MTKMINASSLSTASQPGNSMWVSANAGSGKTRNLITRVARLLLQGALPEKILCLTYTTAAASEMQDRLFKELGSWSMIEDHELTKTLLMVDKSFFKKNKKPTVILNTARKLFAKALETPGGLKIQTIHSFCSGVLRKFPLEINVAPNFKVLDDRQKKEFLDKAIIELLRDDREAFDNVVKLFSVSDIGNFIDQIMSNRSQLIEPFDVVSFCKCFGLSIQSLDIRSEAVSLFKGLPQNIIEILSEALLKGSDVDIRQVQHLKNIKLCEDLEKLDKVKAFFSTNDGKVRSAKSFPSKKAKQSNPELETLINKFRDNFLKYLERQSQIGIINKSKVIYSFSQKFFKIYEKIKLVDGFLDYDDLIIKTRDLLLNAESKWVLFKLDGGIDHILLDEAQDTSVHQWEMLACLMDDFFFDERSLAGERTFYAVGDEKQSIYSFQGADIKSFSYMKEFFSSKLSSNGNKLESVELRNSFRSSQAVLAFVNEILLEGGGTGVKKINDHLAYDKELPGRVEVWPLLYELKSNKTKFWWSYEREAVQISAVERLAEKIAIKIKKTLQSEQILLGPNTEGDYVQRKVVPSDFLILVRRRGVLFSSILKKLSDYNLPIAGSDRLFLLSELAIKDIVSLLKFLTNPIDDLSLAEALRSPLLGLSEKELFTIAHQRDCPLFNSLEHHFPDHESCYILRELLKNVKILSPYDLIERLLINHKGRLRLTARFGQDINDVLDEFLTQALNYEEGEPPSMYGFLQWLDVTQLGVKRQLQNDKSNIRVMTIHGSKGLEAPIVIIPDTFHSPRPNNKLTFLQKEGWISVWENAQCLPSAIKNLKKQKLLEELEEENRLFYVAITRARNWLIICGVKKGKEREESLESNWYFRSKNALRRLSLQKLSQEAQKKETVLFFEHNWNKNSSFRPSKDLIKNDLNTDDHNQSRRLKRLLLENELPISREDNAISVSKLLSKFKTYKSTERSGDTEIDKDSSIYGSLVHSFLQLLPVHSNQNIKYIKNLVYEKFKKDLINFDLIDRSFMEARGVLENTDLCHLLRSPNSLREVSVSSLLSVPKTDKGYKKNQIRIRGKIDLLNVTSSEILIVDFKTTSKIPSSVKGVDLQILGQLELYYRILHNAYPNHEMVLAILWTKTARLMRIPQVTTDAALNNLFANQVLDDV